VIRRRWLVVGALFTFSAVPMAAQQSEQTAIIAVVDALFEGMRTKDTTAMRALFLPQARMVGLDRQGKVTANPVDGWIASIGRSAAGTELRERTWAHEVRVDGAIAQAWMQYDFHIGERFSHCGVDAFDFVKVEGAWKIIGVMDTRRTEGCTPPPAGR
jgi:hypothetical protein